MRWLIISPPELKIENNPFDMVSLVKHILKNNDATFSVFKTGNKKNLENFLAIAGQCTHFVVLKNFDSDEDFINDFYLGYLAGRNVLTFAITSHNSLEKYFPKIKWMQSVQNIAAEIDKNYKIYQKENLRVVSLNKLLTKGIPFTPDAFASYLERTNCEICELFLHAQMDLNSRDSTGTPMLNIACRYENFECVKWLIENGADVNCISEDRGYSPVMDSVWKKNMKITKYLIMQNAELNFISKEGQSILVLAVGIGNPQMCSLLVENGADPDIIDSMGMSAYEYAKLFKKKEIIDSLEKFHKNRV